MSTSYTDFYGLTLPPCPSTRTPEAPAPIVTAAVDALLPYVKPDERATVAKDAGFAPATYLHGLLEANPGRLPQHVRDLVEAAINVVGPAERRRAKQADDSIRRLEANTYSRNQGLVGLQFRGAPTRTHDGSVSPEFQQAHTAMLQRMGATHTQAAREAAAYSRYVADSLGH